MISPGTLATAAAGLAQEALVEGLAANLTRAARGPINFRQAEAGFIARGLASSPAARKALAAAKQAAATSARRPPTRRRSLAGYATPATARAATSKATTAAKATTSTSKATASKATSTSSRTTGELAFLSDPKLSIEEKLFRFMALMEQRYEDKLQAKMKEVGEGDAAKAGTASTSSGSAASAPKKKGLLGKLGDVVKSTVVGGVGMALLGDKGVQSVLKTISGPVLGAAVSAMGLPALAPLAAKAGPQVADALIGLAKELNGGASSSAGGSGTSGSSASGASSAESSKSEQVQMMELQQLVDKQKEMFNTITNVLRAMHDTRMAVIGNLR